MVLEFIREKARRRWDPPQVYEALKEEVDKGRQPYLPDQKTVRKWTLHYRPPAPEDPWSLSTENEYIDPALVLDAIAAVVKETGGRVSAISTEQAVVLSRIRSSRPELPPWIAYVCAIEHVRLRDEKAKLNALPIDLLIATAPWRDDESFDAYMRLPIHDGEDNKPWLAWSLIGGVIAQGLSFPGVDAPSMELLRDFTTRLVYLLDDEQHEYADQVRTDLIRVGLADLQQSLGLADLQQSLEGVFSDAKKS